jgi:hypothetical protein
LWSVGEVLVRFWCVVLEVVCVGLEVVCVGLSVLCCGPGGNHHSDLLALNTSVFTFYAKFANLLGLMFQIHSESASHQWDYSR